MLLLLISLFTAQADHSIHFPELLHQVDKANFGSEQLMIISTIPASEELTSKQVVQLIDELAFSKDKLKALQELAPHISDPHNGYLLIKSFDYASDKKEAQTIIENLQQQKKQDLYQERVELLERKLAYLQEKEQELVRREQELYAEETRLKKWKRKLQERKSALDRREQIVVQKEQAVKDRHARNNDEDHYRRHRKY